MAAGLTGATAFAIGPLAPAAAPGRAPRQYRRDIDGLRGIAVLAVVLYHADARLLPGGFLGVDVFFVISGFLITELVRAGIDDGSFGVAEFLDRRLRRIVPALAIVLASVFLVGALTMFPAELVTLGRNTWAGATFTLNLMRFHDGPGADYFAPAALTNPLLHLWSLGVEEQFYLFWPAALLLLSRAGGRWVRGGALAICGAALGAFLALTFDHELAAFYLPSSRMWELLAGALLTLRVGASASTSPTSAPPWRGAIGLAGLATLAMAFVGAPGNPLGRVVGTAVSVAASAAIIAAGPGGWMNRKILSRSPLVYLGLVSYPWYLWHWPLLTFLRVRGGRPDGAALAVAVLLSLVLAAATYAFVERPLRRRAARPLRVPLLATLLLLAALGAAAQAGLIVTPVTRERAPLVAASMDWATPGRGIVTNTREGLRLISFGSERPARTVVFIGDSHVEQYWPRVEALRQRLIDSATRVVFITRAGCAPLPTVERLAQPELHCLAFTRAAFAYARRPEVTTVALGARWEGYFLAPYDMARNDAAPTLELERPGGDGHAIRLGTPAALALEHSLTEQLATLRALGKDLVVIGPNPGDRRFDPRAMLDPITRRARAAGPIPADAYAGYLAPVTSFLRRATKDGALALTLDPMTELCSSNQCPLTDSSGAPLYRDADHVRASTARRLTIVDSVLWHGGGLVAAPRARR